MKKFILAITVAAFTVGAFAGDSCCDKDKAATEKSKEAASCPASKESAKKDEKSKPAEAPKGDQKKS